MKLVVSVFITLLLCERFSPIRCSAGDNSRVYTSCLSKFEKENCTNNGQSFKSKSALQQDFWSRLMQWTCRDECRYQCMWITVTMFHNAGEDTPKFHGRWPFVRILGMQEPASVFASVLNFAANAYMYRKLRRLPTTKSYVAPFIKLWHGFAMVCMNAWTWSTIFHTRDTWFTEFMDYACALSMVMGLFVTAVVRVFYSRSKLMTFTVLLVPLFYFVTHVRYLYSGVINYDYNMKVNVVFGVLGSLIWLAVSWRQWRSGRRYAWRMLAFTLLSGAALSLELFDFPPKLSVWDAHALWHLSTAPLPLLFYKYVIDDLRYLASRDLEKFALKLT
uniref:Post-GPI attachment to proteins factor 3 n=1 Tax=Heliothis virescens TaxID=7102 RepID=A0A2A4J571_HELVI